jgi:hypothetical protein
MFVQVAKSEDITVGNMKHVEARCGHMNARLSLGGLNGNIVNMSIA